MPNASLDPIEVAKVLAGLAVSQQIAAIIGPYAIILLASIGGAAAALANTKAPLERVAAFWFFGRACLFSMLMTVPAATFVSKYSDSWEAQWFFIPAAFVISYCSDKGKAIAGFLGEQVMALIRNWVNRGQPKKEDQ